MYGVRYSTITVPHSINTCGVFILINISRKCTVTSNALHFIFQLITLNTKVWKAEKLQHALLRRLRPGSAMQFTCAAEELKYIMCTLGEKFDPSKSPDSCDEKVGTVSVETCPLQFITLDANYNIWCAH